ncbi:MAG: class E sortase [Coriobacteriales bacterium]|nr:class E sortase [Actinomycetes bacterium]
MNTRARLLRVLGNAFLGLALGLVGYYGITSILAACGQSAVSREFERFGGIAENSPTRIDVVPGAVLDFTGWETEDRAYWQGLAPGAAFGRLVVPAMRLDVTVVKGVSVADLKKGPGWVTYTDLPGPSGNCGISGHRTTYGAPFRRLDALRPGDTIDLYSPYRRYRYVVDRTFSVTPDRSDVFDSTVRPTLTLTACHPPLSARYRLVVVASLDEVRRLADVRGQE